MQGARAYVKARKVVEPSPTFVSMRSMNWFRPSGPALRWLGSGQEGGEPSRSVPLSFQERRAPGEPGTKCSEDHSVPRLDSTLF